MYYIIIGVIAVICIALYISIVNQRAKNKMAVLMLLLENEERSSGDYMVICYGRDSAALDRLLKSMVRQGLLDEVAIVRDKSSAQPVYKLTREGYRFAIQLRNTYRRRNS
jgi:hypothetical protein